MAVVNPIVFISHSHLDRAEASRLDQVLRRNGARTFFDQRDIEPGSALPTRVQEGIERSTLLLLLWSASASRSDWVNSEWNLAYDKRKPILPYRLDSTPLPAGLSHLVYVDESDKHVTNANLLRAVFGTPVTKADESFVGRWCGKAQLAIYDIELRPNGQIIGTMEFERSGFGVVLGFLVSGFAVDGTWRYDRAGQILTWDVTIRGGGQSNGGRVEIRMADQRGGTLSGRDVFGREFVLHRCG